MSSLLETFGILFESDSSDVERGAEDAENSTESLDDKIKETDKSTKDLGESFLGLVSSAKGAIASVLSLGALTAGVVATAEMTDEIGKFSQTLGLNISEVSAWGEAVVRSGGSANGFRSSLDGMSKGLADFAITGSGTFFETLSRIGVSITDEAGKVRSAFDLLPDIASAFSGLSASDSASLGDRLGLDQGTILLLQQGKRSVEELVDRQKQLGVATKEDYEIAALFNDQWADTKQIFQSLSLTTGTTILPMFTSILKGIEKTISFMKENDKFFKGFFLGISGIVAVVFGPSMYAAAAATLAAISPFILMGAAIIIAASAIGIIVDDIYNFINGNDSLIGHLKETYPEIGRFIDEISKLVNLAIDGFSMLSGAILSAFGAENMKPMEIVASLINKIFSAINSVIGLLYDLSDVFITAFTSPKDALDLLLDSLSKFGSEISGLLPDLSGAFDGIAKTFGFDISAKSDDSEISGLLPDLSGAFDDISKTFGFDISAKSDDLEMQTSDNIKKIENNIVNASEFLSKIDANPLNGQTSSSISTSNRVSRTTNVQVGKVDVNTQATNAEEMARATGGALQKEMQSAVNNMDNGIAY